LIASAIFLKKPDLSEINRIRTGACSEKRLKEIIRSNVFLATASFNFGSSTTINSQGWELLAEGASRAASR